MATDFGKRIYTTHDQLKPIRCRKTGDQKFVNMEQQINARNDTHRQESNYDKFKNTLVDGYTIHMHKTLVTHYLEQGGYMGVTLAMVQAQSYQECQRAEDTLSVVTSDTGAYPMVDPTMMGVSNNQTLTVKVTVTDFNTTTNKSEMVCSVRCKEPITCIFFLVGLHYFYKHVVLDCPEPPGLVPPGYTSTTNLEHGNSSSHAPDRPETVFA